MESNLREWGAKYARMAGEICANGGKRQSGQRLQELLAFFRNKKPPLTEGKVSTGVGVMSYFGGNFFSQNLTVLPAPSVRGAVCAADWGS